MKRIITTRPRGRCGPRHFRVGLGGRSRRHVHRHGAHQRERQLDRLPLLTITQNGHFVSGNRVSARSGCPRP